MAGIRRAGAGRKCDLKAVRDELVELIGRGLYFDTACRIVGITRASMYRWLRYGRIPYEECAIRPEDGARVYPDGIIYNVSYEEFLEDVERAAAKAERDALMTVLDASKEVDSRTGLTQWTAAAWYLERMHPHKYGRRVEIAAVDDTSRGEIEDEAITPDQMERMANATLRQATVLKQIAAAQEEL
jgi:hypothetical protein